MSGLRAGCAVFFISFLFAPAVNAVVDNQTAKQVANQTIRVRLKTIENSISISGVGLRIPGTGKVEYGYRAYRISEKSLPDGFAEWSVVDRDDPSSVHKIKARGLPISGENLRLNLRSVPNHLNLVPMSKGVSVVAEMNLEDYVRGVLPAEMPRGWPLEALKAQAIAARTFALHRKALASHVTFDVEASVMDQMYEFSNLPDSDNQIARAVNETRGVVLTSRGSRSAPLAAYYHADCGGQTENARAVWGTEGAGTAVDKGCPLNPKANWKFEVSRHEVARRLRGAHARVGELELNKIELLNRNASGRVSQLRLHWGRGAEAVAAVVAGNHAVDSITTDISAADFRMAVGHDRLRSTNFNIESQGDKLVFVGRGFGHGVGLCQWGARHMAMSGHNYREILHHYYPQSDLSEPLLARSE
jgi:stage II sporulation protein D